MGLDVDASQVAHLRMDLGSAPARVQAPAADAVDDFVSGVERDARAFAPIDTGELKSLIFGRRVGLLGEVASEADYSEYVEDGTSDTAPQPFMQPAFERNLPLVERGLGDAGESIL